MTKLCGTSLTPGKEKILDTISPTKRHLSIEDVFYRQNRIYATVFTLIFISLSKQISRYILCICSVKSSTQIAYPIKCISHKLQTHSLFNAPLPHFFSKNYRNECERRGGGSSDPSNAVDRLPFPPTFTAENESLKNVSCSKKKNKDEQRKVLLFFYPSPSFISCQRLDLCEAIWSDVFLALFFRSSFFPLIFFSFVFFLFV